MTSASVDRSTLVDRLRAVADRAGLALEPPVVATLAAILQRQLDSADYRSLSKIAAPLEAVERHLLDSLVPLALPLPCWSEPLAGRAGLGSPVAAADPSVSRRLGCPCGERVADLGTGLGYPALALSAVWPACTVTAIDSRQRPIAHLEWLRAVGPESGIGAAAIAAAPPTPGGGASPPWLANLRPLVGRAEDLGRDPAHRERYDLVVARAVAGLPVLLELALPLVRVGGAALFYKGPEVGAELAAVIPVLDRFALRSSDLTAVGLGPPTIYANRTYVVVMKAEPTPDCWPRRAGVPARRPVTGPPPAADR